MCDSNELERRSIKLKRFAKKRTADILTETKKLPKISNVPKESPFLMPSIVPASR